MDSAAPGGVSGLNDPQVPLGLGLPEFLVVGVKVMELVRQDVGVGDEIELLPAEPLLHLHVVEAQSVFAGDLVALREVVDPLELIQAFIKVALARAA